MKNINGNRATVLAMLVLVALAWMAGRGPRVTRAQDVSPLPVPQSFLASGTVGTTPGQILRLSVANIGVQDVNVKASLISNPIPSLLHQESFTLGPGESRDIDLAAGDVPRELFDPAGRVQIRAGVKSSAPMVLANIEVFDNETGRTSIIIPLQQVASFRSL